MSVDRPRNPRGEGIRLREEILEAAIDLLDETNDRRVLTLRGTARRARISAPSIYPHFDTLSALIDAVLVRSFDELRATVAEKVSRAKVDDPVAILVAAGLAYVQFGWDHPTRYHMMFNADGYAANAIETFTMVESMVGACTDAGLGSSTNPRLDTWMVWAALHGVATLDKPARPEHRRLGTLDRPAMLEVMIRRLARIDEPKIRTVGDSESSPTAHAEES